MKLWQKNILSLALGALIGANFNQLTYLKIFGDIYINITRMIAIPLIFFLIIRSITSLASDSNLKHLITWSLVIFLVTSIIASLIGIEIAIIILNKPIDFTFGSLLQNNTNFEMLFSISPKNIVAMFLEEKVIQIVLFAVFIAYALINTKSPNKVIYGFVEESSILLLNMLSYILKFTPLAVFSYSISLTGNLDVNTMISLAKFFQILFLAYLLQLIVLSLYLKFLTGISPKYFFANSFEYQLFAFSTGSSKASLPYTIQEIIDKFNIPPDKANLLLPMASSFNVVGLSIYLAVTSVFLADMYHVDLSLSNYLMILILAVLSPIGAAGIAGGALLIIPIILTSINLPPESLVLMTAIDPIINGLRTAMNVTHDVAIVLTLDKRNNL